MLCTTARMAHPEKRTAHSPRSGGAPPDAAAGAPGDEGAFVAQVLSGDEAAVTRLVNHHHAAMTCLAAAILGGSANAPDVVQEAWLRVLGGLPQFEFRSSLKTWILRITANVARTAAAKQSRQETIADSSALESTVDPARFTAIGSWRDPPRSFGGSGEAEAALLQGELVALLHREIELLPASQRAVVRLRDVEELSSDEVSALLGLSDANQRVLLHRGRARLRAAIERELGRG